MPLAPTAARSPSLMLLDQRAGQRYARAEKTLAPVPRKRLGGRNGFYHRARELYEMFIGGAFSASSGNGTALQPVGLRYGLPRSSPALADAAAPRARRRRLLARSRIGLRLRARPFLGRTSPSCPHSLHCSGGNQAVAERPRGLR